MYIIGVLLCLFSALSRGVGALQISVIIIIIICYRYQILEPNRCCDCLLHFYIISVNRQKCGRNHAEYKISRYIKLTK